MPERIRFWFSFFCFLNWASLYFAQPLFLGGGFLLLGGALSGKPADKALLLRTQILVAFSSVLVVVYYSRFWPRLQACLERKYAGRPIVEEPALKTGRVRAAAERRGKAAGVAAILGGLLVSLSVVVTIYTPRLPLGSALILGGYALVLVVPMAFLVRYACWGTAKA